MQWLGYFETDARTQRTVHAHPLRPLPRRADVMHMVAPRYWTADMVRALPDDGLRYETIHGELVVSPAPRELHQRVQL